MKLSTKDQELLNAKVRLLLSKYNIVPGYERYILSELKERNPEVEEDGSIFFDNYLNPLDSDFIERYIKENPDLLSQKPEGKETLGTGKTFSDIAGSLKQLQADRANQHLQRLQNKNNKYSNIKEENLSSGDHEDIKNMSPAQYAEFRKRFKQS